MDDQNVYYHNDATPKVAMKVERNSRGFNYEASVSNCASVEEAMALLSNAEQHLRKTYGTEAV